MLPGMEHSLVRGRTMPVYERLELTAVDWQALDAYPDRTILQTPAWLSFVAQTQQAEPIIAILHEGSQRLGHFTGLTVRKNGFRLLGSHFPGWTTSYLGFNLAPGVPHRLSSGVHECRSPSDSHRGLRHSSA